MWRLRLLVSFFLSPLRFVMTVVAIVFTVAAFAIDQRWLSIPLAAIAVAGLLGLVASAGSKASQLQHELKKVQGELAHLRAAAASAANKVAQHETSIAAMVDQVARHETSIATTTNDVAQLVKQRVQDVEEQHAQAIDELTATQVRIENARQLVQKASAGLPVADGETSVGPERISRQSPQITIVVPNYNDATYLADCLASVQQQTFADFECIVIDDASTDESVQVADRFARSDERFSLVRHQKNGGLSAARNTGLRLATAPLIAFLDSDDLFLADNLRERFDSFVAQDEETLAGVFSGIEQCSADTKLEGQPPHKPWSAPGFRDLLTTEGECPFNCHAPLLRTTTVRESGGFDESMLHGAEDWDLWLRLMRRGYVFRPTKNILALYRQKPQSMVRSMPAQHLAEARRMLKSVQQPVQPRPGAPTDLFTKPLHEYQQELVFARRAFQYMGLAVLSDQDEQLAEASEAIDASLLPVFRRHFSPEAFVRAGIQRGLGLSKAAYETIRAETEPLVHACIDLIEARNERVEATPDRDDTVPAAVLFAPTNSFEATRMLRAAESLPNDTSIVFLDVERETGASGVEALLRDAGVKTASLNTWILTKGSHRSLVVSNPIGPVISQLVEASQSLGVSTLSLTADHRLLLEAAIDVHADREVEVDEVADAVAQFELTASGILGTRLVGTHGTRHQLIVEPAVEEYPNLRADPAKLLEFKDRHKGERCVIIGNGPSLNDIDLRLLATESTFAVNGIFYAAENMGFDPTYYVVEDTSVLDENLEEIKAYSAGHKFFPSLYRSKIGEGPDTTFFMMNRGFYAAESDSYCIPRFSADAAQRLFCGQSVTIINLQLAYYMGFAEVALIGMDFSYVIPESADRHGDVLTSNEADPNHFHPDYFGKGKTWKDPKLERVLANYVRAKEVFEADGRRIVNATPGGKLEVFERVDYNQYFG